MRGEWSPHQLVCTLNVFMICSLNQRIFVIWWYECWSVFCHYSCSCLVMSSHHHLDIDEPMGKEDRRGGEEDDRPEQNHWGHCSTLRPEWEDRAGCLWFISFHYLPWNILLEHINEAKGKKNIQERDKVMKMGFTSVWGSWSERQQPGTWNVFFNLQLFDMVGGKDWRTAWKVGHASINQIFSK